MKLKITLLIALLLTVMGVNAKTKTTKTLWEGTYSNHIELSKEKLAVGTLTVYMSWTGDGTHVRAYYKKNDENWTESKFSENSGTITDYAWQNNGTASYEISIAESDMTILNDNTADTGSRGILYIGSADAEKMTITMITLTTTSSESETSTTSIWSGSHDLASYDGLQLTENTYKTKLANAKIGDILRATYTSDEAGYIDFCNGSDWSKLTGGSFSVTMIGDATTVEYEISSATILEAIQQNGIVMNGTNATLSAIDLLTYSSSYDAVAITVGSDGVATYSNGNKNVQISSCDELKAYYASAVATGTVTLTELTQCIPANQGVMIYGTAGTYTVPVGGDGWADIASSNYLKATGDYKANVYRSNTTKDGTDTKYRYIFAKKKKESGDPAFYKLATDYSRTTTEKEGDIESGTTVYYHVLAAHKAYLETDTDISGGSGAPVLMLFDDNNTTAISAVQERKVEDGVYYNLSGQRVQNPTKGLYIVNGKKVIIK